jgi:two-component system phosphate regulon response regulator PhoB
LSWERPDYVVKPFSVREVLLWVKAILRRNAPNEDEPSLRCGAIVLDLPAHTAKIHGKAVDLTITEFRLLEDLLRNREKVRSREQLLDSVWGYSFDGYARTVDTHIRRLRAKLETEADCIGTVRGVGYRAKATLSSGTECEYKGTDV